MRERDSGFTLVELLVTVGLLSIVAVGFYSVVFAGARAGDVTQSVADLSQEARLGFNRLVRDTREANRLEGVGTTLPTATTYRVLVDFNGDGVFNNPPANLSGYYENLIFEYRAATNTITLNGEVLISGVEAIPGTDVFAYQSNRLEYDASGDGVTDDNELVASGSLTEGEIRAYLSSVVFSLRIRSDDRVSDFYAEAQLRNNR